MHKEEVGGGWWGVRLLLHTSFSSLPPIFLHCPHPSTRQRWVQSHHAPCFCTATCSRPPSAACPVQTPHWQSHWRRMMPSSVVQSPGCWAQWRLLQNVFREEMCVKQISISMAWSRQQYYAHFGLVFNREGWERVSVSQTNTGTVLKATVLRLLQLADTWQIIRHWKKSFYYEGSAKEGKNLSK